MNPTYDGVWHNPNLVKCSYTFGGHMIFWGGLATDKILISCYNHDVNKMIGRLKKWYDGNKYFIFDDHITLVSWGNYDLQ